MGKSGPDLTVVVNVHNMRREAPRTLASLMPGYQRDAADLSYDIVVIDHGSAEPLDPTTISQVCGDRGHHVVVETDVVSPAAAINTAVRNCSSEWVMCLIDGARIASPGVVSLAMSATRAFPQPFVYTLSMHLGHQRQNVALAQGYDQAAEDALLSTVDWQTNGYELFTISTVPVRREGFFAELSETNCFLMRRTDFLGLGGFSEEFRSPGGGLANHDFFNRVHDCNQIQPVLLLGEATFHQFHGGVSTNVPLSEHPWKQFAEEYRGIRKVEFCSSWRPPIYLGELRKECRDLILGDSDGATPVSRLARWRRATARLNQGRAKSIRNEGL